MKTKLLALALTVVLAGSNTFFVQASTNLHVHIYDKDKYVKTTQDGSYTHSYITGVNPSTGTITYGTCLVMCETEYYTHQCIYDGCFATDGKLYAVPVESHGSCPK